MNLLAQAKEPLFPDILWSRPENKKLAGNLLIIGSTSHAFSGVAQAHGYATKAGIGQIKVMMPESLKSTLTGSADNFLFVSATATGEIAKRAEVEMLSYVTETDGVLLPGDLGRNSETTSVITNALSKSEKQITLSGDAIELVIPDINSVLKRKDTCLVAGFAQLQKIFKTARHHKAIVYTMPTQKLAEVLSEFTKDYAVILITMHNDQIFVAYKEKVSVTRFSKETADWQIRTASYASVFWLQNPTKPFESITTAIYDLARAKN